MHPVSNPDTTLYHCVIRGWSGLKCMHAVQSAPFWVILGNIDSAEHFAFYKEQRAACGSRCLTQFQAPRLSVSPTLLRDSSLQPAWKHLTMRPVHQSLQVHLDALCLCLPCFLFDLCLRELTAKEGPNLILKTPFSLLVRVYDLPFPSSSVNKVKPLN